MPEIAQHLQVLETKSVLIQELEMILALVEVADLLETNAMVEIKAIASIEKELR